MYRRSSRIGLIGLTLIAAAGPAVIAQQSSGAFKGRVVEATGKAKAGVTVTLKNHATNATRVVTSDPEGNYRFSLLPVGRYKVTYQVGDRSYSIEATATLGVDAELPTFRWPADAAAIVVVTASAEALSVNTNSAETGVNVNSEVLKDLPVLSRNVIEAAVLAPGVQLVSGGNVDPTKKSSSYISSGEGQGRGTNFAVDGADNNSTDVGGYVSNIPLDAIGEFQVVTNMYKAEFGRSNAGFFNVVTKSGGNEFLGSVSGQYTGRSLRARRTDETGNPKESDRRLNTTVSGPIIKDKLFYMLSVERQDAESQSFLFPADALTVFPGLSSANTEIKATTVYGKLDYSPSSNWSLAMTLGFDKNETPNQAFPNTTRALGRIDPGMLGTGKNETSRGSLKSTFTSGNVSWESLLSYFDYSNGITPAAGFHNGTPMQVRTGIGDTDATHVGRMGVDVNAFQNTGIKRLQFRNDVSYVASDHMFKFGFDFQSSKYADQRLFFPETGIYQFWTDQAYGPEVWSNSFDPNAHFLAAGIVPDGFTPGSSFKQYGAYVQDDWQINNKWSVYAGLRMDKDTVFDFMQAYTGMYQQMHAANPQFVGSAPPSNRTYVSPRISVIYRPLENDDLVFRMGAGRFVANTIDNVVGFSRAMGARVNGLPNGGELAYEPNVGSGGFALGSLSVTSFGPGPIFYETGDPYLINGHQLVLPSALTPYNYVNNVGGLRDYFRTTVNSWLTPASFNTSGKPLVDSDFRYPTTDQINLAVTFRFLQNHVLDVNLLQARTRNNTVQYTTDGSGPRAFSSDGTTSVPDPAHDMGDAIFRSNQTSRSTQIQMKYTYTRPRLNFVFNVVAKDNRSSSGGSAGSFDASGLADFYGSTATPVYEAGPERRSAGSESLLGSLSLSYRFESGTHFGLLGSWHSGKAYDVFLGYVPTSTGGISRPDVYHPSPYLGFREGAWAMDLGLRVAHTFKLGKSQLEPFVQVSNILNNYDYGAGYTANPLTVNSSFTAARTNPRFGKRSTGYQYNSPRQAAFGFRWAF